MSEQKKCKQCGTDFEVTNEDIEFLKKSHRHLMVSYMKSPHLQFALAVVRLDVCAGVTKEIFIRERVIRPIKI